MKLRLNTHKAWGRPHSFVCYACETEQTELGGALAHQHVQHLPALGLCKPCTERLQHSPDDLRSMQAKAMPSLARAFAQRIADALGIEVALLVWAEKMCASKPDPLAETEQLLRLPKGSIQAAVAHVLPTA